MQELLDTLGIKGPVILLQIVAFVVLYWLLRRFLFGPVREMLESRRREIDEGLKAAEEVRQESARLSQEREKFIAEAREEGRALMQRMTREASETRERLLAEAQAEREAALNRGREMIEMERRRAISELRDEVSELALRAARRAVQEAMDENAHRKAIDAFIADLESQPREGGANESERAN